MQVHFDNFAVKINLHILNCVDGNNFHSKINKICKIKQFNGCASENLKKKKKTQGWLLYCSKFVLFFTNHDINVIVGHNCYFTPN